MVIGILRRKKFVERKVLIQIKSEIKMEKIIIEYKCKHTLETFLQLLKSVNPY